jgi:hypothetical protein
MPARKLAITRGMPSSKKKRPSKVTTGKPTKTAAKTSIQGIKSSIEKMIKEKEIFKAAVEQIIESDSISTLRGVKTRVLSSAMQAVLPMVSKVTLSGIQSHAMGISASMDPRLQVACARRRMGMPGRALASVARLTDCKIKVASFRCWRKGSLP